jgi:regulator of sigma D
MKTTQKAKDKQAADKQSAENERRRGTRESVSKMVAERTEVLALYWRLAGMDPFAEAGHREPVEKLLQEFCQLLVDYIAVGHFSLYERIVNGTERRRELATLAQDLYPRIADTTTTALDFNDKYDCGDHFEITESFKSDLSHLGEELARRIDLEDKLIKAMIA